MAILRPARGGRGASRRSERSGSATPAAGHAVEDRLRRPQLQGSRGRTGQAAAEGAADLHQAVDVGRSVPATRSCLPPGSGRVDHEAELGDGDRPARASRSAERTRWDYILGLTCVNDVTARELQSKESQYTRCKGFDTFAPIGPCIATAWRLNGAGRGVEGWVNGERRQTSSTAQLIFPIEQLVEFITFVMTLEPGDIISTGTPAGIGPIQAGDVVRSRSRAWAS